MRHADAFLRTVLAAPDDDAPRLIYADWLDEQGECDRAEFIRVQCALARGGWEGDRGPELRRRERELLRRHEGAWVGALADFVSGWTFERGFVGGLTVMTEAFLRHAALIFELAPARHVKLRGARRHMAALAAEPALQSLASLDLSFNLIDPVGAATFFRSPYLGSLAALNLCWNALGSDGVRTLAEARSLAAPRHFNLERTIRQPGGVSVVAASPVCAALTELSLAGNALSAADVRALAHSASLKNLQVLDLGDTGIDARGRALLRERFGEGVCRF
jgi:uncharacterized protein (TIGR02996 family)